MATLNFYAFFVFGIVVQKTNFGSNRNFSDIREFGQLNIINQPLVDRQKIVLPPLYIK